MSARIFISRGSFVTAALALFLGAATPASAAVIYSYSSDNYAIAGGLYDTSMNISGSFTLDTALPSNFALAPVAGLPGFTFSINDGVRTLTDADVPTFDSFTFRIGTDAAGAINYWDIFLLVSASPLDAIQTVHFLIGNDCNSNANAGQNDLINDFGFNFTVVPGATSCALGEWTGPVEANVPEPGTLALVGASLLGFGIVRRRRRTI